MAKPESFAVMPCVAFKFTIFVLVPIFAVLSFSQPVYARDSSQETTEDYCLSCHADPDLDLTFPDGETLSLYISPEALSHSVHSSLGIECIACHTDIRSYPHPPVEFNNPRELAQSYFQACQKCHSDLFAEAMDSIHAAAVEQGSDSAPICTDCHTAHAVQAPDEPRSQISLTCGECHTEVFDVYRDSVHGAALLEAENPDVPVCTDCHGVHAIQDPTAVAFRVETPELCAGCHADPELMSQYGLNSDVYSTYQLSWHGVDVTVYQARWPNLWHSSAVCTDCHGVHNILSSSDPQSSVHPDNLLGTCQQCHPGAGPQFVGAWTGHTQIDLQRNPYVFYTDIFYRYFAYLVLMVSAIYVLLQILRATVVRVRRSLG
ncbi:MAG: cytochrome C [Chloroflexi bacterium]|jgi:predicted CXXCH cytochrome family protein|nr:cytochrome C [Chloroflexota bacterium]